MPDGRHLAGLASTGARPHAREVRSEADLTSRHTWNLLGSALIHRLGKELAGRNVEVPL
jgi:hypothetical protein